MLRTKHRCMATVVVAVVFCLGVAFAQPGMGFGFCGDDEPSKGKRDEAKDMLSTVYLMELTKELELAKEQALDIASIIEKHEKAKVEHQKAIRESLRGIKLELGNDKPDEKKLKKYIAQITSARDKMKDEQGKGRDEIMSKLSVTQQAKFILFHTRWMKKLQRIKEHIRGEKMRRRDGPGRMGGGPCEMK
ncbi:MAG TPA: hypothetical protein VM163_11355 [bacterium]|nr:hypothetical protein [bacterium]